MFFPSGLYDSQRSLVLDVIYLVPMRRKRVAFTLWQRSIPATTPSLLTIAFRDHKIFIPIDHAKGHCQVTLKT
jgi:hypothetical protein